MRIVYIIERFPKLSEAFILNEIVALQEKGVEIFVFSLYEQNEVINHPAVQEVNNVFYPRKINGWKKAFYHLQWLFTKPLGYIRAMFTALKRENHLARFFLFSLDGARLIYRLKPDCIHAHFGGIAADYALLVNLLSDLPFTFTTHRHYIFDDPPKNYGIKSRRAKKHITISKYNKNYLIRKFPVEESKLAIVHCGINFNTARPDRNDNNENGILAVARLESHKCLDHLIRACGILHNEGVDFQCRIIGEGPERDNLEKLIDELGLQKHVTLPGWQSQEDVYALLAESKVFVLPSRSEGIPVSAMEAMVMKVPVIITNVFGVSELVEDRISGILTPVDDVNSLAGNIKLLLWDQGLRERCINNGYNKIVDDFNLDKEVQKLITLWGK